MTSGLLDYRPERARQLAQTGLRLITLLGEERQYVLNITHEAAVIGPCELVLVNVKAHQTRNAAQHLPALLGSGGIALTLQNGIGNVEIMAEVVGPERLLAGVAMLGVTKLDVNRIRHAGHGQIVVGRPPASRVTTQELTEVVHAFEQAGLDCQPTVDILAVLWNKLLINVGINPVTALTRLTNGQLPAVPEVWEVVTAAVAGGLCGGSGPGHCSCRRTFGAGADKSAKTLPEINLPCFRMSWPGARPK